MAVLCPKPVVITFGVDGYRGGFHVRQFGIFFNYDSIGVFPRATTVVAVGWSLFAWEKLERRRGSYNIRITCAICLDGR